MTFKYNKIIIISFLFTINIFFVPLLVNATGSASFKTVDATDITHDEALLRGNFKSTYMENFPLIWFQYGVDPKKLDNRTVEVVGVAGDYISSQLIYRLDPNTRYYFRTALKLDSQVVYGDTLSFVTKGAQEESQQIPVNYVDDNGNLTLDGMLQQYDSYQKQNSKGNLHTGISTGGNNETEDDDGSYSFFDFLGWFRKDKKIETQNNKGKTDNNSSDNSVHSDEEIDSINKKRSVGTSDENQKHYSNSAAEDDEWGEIVDYNPNYKNSYRGKKTFTQNKQSSLNYSRLFLIIIIFIIIIILLRIVYLKFVIKKHFQKNVLSTSDNYTSEHPGRYYIPIHKELENSIPDPSLTPITKNEVSSFEQKEQQYVRPKTEAGTTFFRKPPRK